MVWIHDTNVSLAKYILLPVAALFFFAISIPYTLLLLLGHWLQCKFHLCSYKTKQSLMLTMHLTSHSIVTDNGDVPSG